MPASDYGSRAGTPGSNPSSGSFGGGGFSGGVGGNRSSNSGNTGLKTGSTIYGNTAFGPAGGRAVGYATRSGPINGMGPSVGTFSNFRTPAGAPMVGGALQNRAVTARNPQQALGMLQALAGVQRPRVGGLLADEGVTVGDIPSITPAAGPVVAPQEPDMIDLRASAQRIRAMLGGGGMLAYGLNPSAGGSWVDAAKRYYGGYGRPVSSPQSNASAAYSSMFSRNPTSFPQGATGWRRGY